MKKLKILVAILIAIIALLVVYIVWGQQFYPIDSILQLPGRTNTAASPSAGDVIPEATSGYVSAGDDVFTDTAGAAGKKVELEGTIYNDPQNNQGILSFNIQTDNMHFAFINYLDMDSTVTLHKGDRILVRGVVTNSVQSEDPGGQLLYMPMISANIFEKK